MIPIRFIFRSRWAALAWAAGVCLTAVSFAGGDKVGGIDATKSADGPAAQISALNAEEPE